MGFWLFLFSAVSVWLWLIQRCHRKKSANHVSKSLKRQRQPKLYGISLFLPTKQLSPPLVSLVVSLQCIVVLMPVRRKGPSHSGGRAGRIWLVVGIVAFVLLGVHDLSTRTTLTQLQQEHSELQDNRDTLEDQASKCGATLHDLT